VLVFNCGSYREIPADRVPRSGDPSGEASGRSADGAAVPHYNASTARRSHRVDADHAAAFDEVMKVLARDARMTPTRSPRFVTARALLRADVVDDASTRDSERRALARSTTAAMALLKLRARAPQLPKSACSTRRSTRHTDCAHYALRGVRDGLASGNTASTHQPPVLAEEAAKLLKKRSSSSTP